MPTGGAGRKPTHLKIVEGTFRPDRAPKHEITPKPARTIEPPKDLDRYARQFWARNAPTIQRLGLLTEADLESWYAMCLAASRFEHANVRLRAIYRKKQVPSEEIRRAEVSVEQASRELRQFWSEFGMTPAARSRLEVYAPPPDAEMDEYERTFGSGTTS